MATPGARLGRGIVINGIGAVTTGVIALIVIESKFLAGAWMVVIAIPILVLLMLAHPPALSGRRRPARLDRIPPGGRSARADRDRADRAARRAGAPGDRLRELDLDDPIAVHVTNDADGAEEMRARWPDWSGGASWS